MQATLTSYTLIGIDAVSVKVEVDGDQARVIDPETGRVIHSVRLDRTGSVPSAIEHLVNTRTSPLRKRAPADLKKDANGGTAR